MYNLNVFAGILDDSNNRFIENLVSGILILSEIEIFADACHATGETKLIQDRHSIRCDLSDAAIADANRDSRIVRTRDRLGWPRADSQRANEA